MLTSISRNQTHYINNAESKKVKKKHINTLAKQLKSVKNDYKKLKSDTRNRVITNEFEIDESNKDALKNYCATLTDISNEAKNKIKKMNDQNYAFKRNESKLKKLESLFIKAETLKGKIAHKLNKNSLNEKCDNDYHNRLRDTTRLAKNWEMYQQRIRERDNGIYNGGMVK